MVLLKYAPILLFFFAGSTVYHNRGLWQNNAQMRAVVTLIPSNFGWSPTAHWLAVAACVTLVMCLVFEILSRLCRKKHIEVDHDFIDTLSDLQRKQWVAEDYQLQHELGF